MKTTPSPKSLCCVDCGGAGHLDIQARDGSVRTEACRTCRATGARLCDCGCRRVAVAVYDGGTTALCATCDAEVEQEMVALLEVPLAPAVPRDMRITVAPARAS